MPDDLDGWSNATAPYLELVAVTLARVHFKAVDDLARAAGADSRTPLDVAAATLEGLDGLLSGRSMSSGPPLRTLLTRSVTTRGVRNGSGSTIARTYWAEP